MRATYHAALDAVFEHEGGFVNHRLDPGGATNMGITHKVLARFRGVKRVSVHDVRNLRRTEAASIYLQNYWHRVKCDELPSGVDLAVFDCAVNQGVSRATRFLQQAARVRVDGVIGPVTLRSIHAREPGALLDEFCARRMNHYGRLSRLFRTFGLGWSRRLIDIHHKAIRQLDALSQVIKLAA